jgi:5'-deoxynucleotidase YfbR-like HD superfamily hydrolase
MTWVQTVSGVAFDLLAPRAEDVRVADIAHSLARINRFSGHTLGEPYSVAHHSMLVADILASWGCPVAIVREGLLHDAPEAYYGDTVSPVAAALRLLGEPEAEPFRAAPLARLHERVDCVVRAALALPEHETAIVKRADLVALAIERRDLMASCERDWELPEYAPATAPCGRLHGAGRVVVHVGITGKQLCSWDVASDRFAAYLADLDEACGVSR